MVLTVFVRFVKSVNNLEISTRTLTLTGVVDDELISVASLGSH